MGGFLTSIKCFFFKKIKTIEHICEKETMYLDAGQCISANDRDINHINHFKIKRSEK